MAVTVIGSQLLAVTCNDEWQVLAVTVTGRIFVNVHGVYECYYDSLHVQRMRESNKVWLVSLLFAKIFSSTDLIKCGQGIL